MESVVPRMKDPLPPPPPPLSPLPLSPLSLPPQAASEATMTPALTAASMPLLRITLVPLHVGVRVEDARARRVPGSQRNAVEGARATIGPAREGRETTTI